MAGLSFCTALPLREGRNSEGKARRIRGGVWQTPHRHFQALPSKFRLPRKGGAIKETIDFHAKSMHKFSAFAWGETEIGKLPKTTILVTYV